MVDYPIPDKLHANPAIHCAALAITRNALEDRKAGLPRFAEPEASLRNGTLTFVRSNGRTYAITCQHVVQHYRDMLEQSGQEFSHSMRTMLNGFHIVMDRFIQPHAKPGDEPPDIAIREINPSHIAHIGKQPLDLDTLGEPPENMRHAYAVGFPETLKYNRHDAGDPFGYRVSIPQVEILAELSRRPDRRFTMFSELVKPAADIEYSGMSGGPIFWSTEDEYGILGIIYEGGPGHGNGSIYVYGEIATPEVVRDWIAQCPPRDS
ncbi:hypothetical protein A8950_3489 [Dongia mobilis]|uniref:Trypsin-like peptidase n=1 Tax=Dongia mobilis TaxID=578943 RepID=A0A4R6WIW5_9PROT|nr:hypothetical protein [Dongia mobilis]TDQ78440.1 hypothetical protein A8950_3489 [Dongia mobilis]